MNKLVLVAFMLLPFSANAQKHFSYLGVNLGGSVVDSAVSNETDSKTGLYYGGVLGHEVKFDNRFNLNLGLEYNVQEIETTLQSPTFEKVFLESKYFMISLNPTYSISKSIDLGIKADFAVGNDGILVSQTEGATELIGLNMFYNIPMKKNKMRIGLAVQTATTDTSYVQAGVTFQYAFGWTKKATPKPRPVVRAKPPVKQVIVKKEITLISFGDDVVRFGNDSAVISEKSKAFLAELGTFLHNNEKNWESVEIVGHTSSAGSAKYNKYLSYKRANAVFTVLKDMGVSVSKIAVEGAGESQPSVWPEINEETAAKNRRVELKFIRMKENAKLNSFINLLRKKHEL